ncbi:MAG TPA: GNAT family N-acetyltransferase [Bacillota bacterium]|nr:GNAT family N-acetyltransferase [Bacillota bacterium]
MVTGYTPAIHIGSPPLRVDEFNTLRQDKNPAFEQCEAKYFLALKDGKTAGRIAAIVNQKYIAVEKKRMGQFGWFDFIDDLEVSGALLDAMETFVREKGMDGIIGPQGFSDFDRIGMLVEGFEELATIAALYNYAYYPRHVEAHGYVKDFDSLEFEMLVPKEIPPILEKVNNKIMKDNKYRIIHAKNARELMNYVDDIGALIDESHIDISLTSSQFRAYAKQYFNFLNPDFVKIIMDQNEKLCAFAVSIPSLSRAFQKCRGRLFPFGFLHLMKALRKNDTLDLYLVGVRPDLQSRGVNSLLMTEIIRGAMAHGMVRAEANPERESNTKVQSQWKYFETRQHKRRRFYVKRLTPVT